MANPTDRLPENVPGRYYVDADCIACDQCREMAPALIGRRPYSSQSYIQRQPASPDELALIEEALGACPISAIGNVGA